MQTEVFIGLGSNSGSRLRNLKRALALLDKSGQVRLIGTSRIYETSAIGPRQKDFLNAAVRAETSLAPEELLTFLKKIERDLGRVPTERWGPRTIDLDILFYGRKKLKTERLTLPHPRYQDRKFVLKPLCDLAPQLKPPGSRLTLTQILSGLTEKAQRVKLHAHG